MLGRDQIKAVAREIDRSADERIHNCDDQFDTQQLWEVVRRARYLVAELESALDAARRASVVVDWNARAHLEDA